MVILSTPLIVIDVSSNDAVAKMLLNYSTDWQETLRFLSSVSSENGFEMDALGISEIMNKAYGE